MQVRTFLKVSALPTSRNDFCAENIVQFSVHSRLSRGFALPSHYLSLPTPEEAPLALPRQALASSPKDLSYLPLKVSHSLTLRTADFTAGPLRIASFGTSSRSRTQSRGVEILCFIH